MINLRNHSSTHFISAGKYRFFSNNPKTNLSTYLSTIQRSFLKNPSTLNPLLISKYSEVQSGKVGFSEGSSLSYLLRNEYNESFINEVISNEEGKNKYQIGEINIEFFSPSKECLLELKSSWEKILDQKDIKRKILTNKHAKAFEKYLNTLNKTRIQSQEISSNECALIDECAESNYEPDTSVANKSSFSFLVSDDSKKVLMLGDSHIETINEYMNQNGLKHLQKALLKK